MKRIAAAILVLIGMTGVFVAPAHADEQWCTGGTTIIGGPGDPLTLAVLTTQSGALTRATLCYAIAPTGTSGMLAAGSFTADNYHYGEEGNEGYVVCDGDATSTVSPDCRYDYGATTKPTITPAYGASGVTLTAEIPFRLCAGSCITDTGVLQTTGAVVGTLSPIGAPSGSTGAGYELEDVMVIVNGTPVYRSDVAVGLFVTPNDAVASSATFGWEYGPCALGTCAFVPTGYLKLTGNDPTVTITAPGTGGPVPITVPLPYVCIYENDSYTAC